MRKARFSAAGRIAAAAAALVLLQPERGVAQQPPPPAEQGPDADVAAPRSEDEAPPAEQTPPAEQAPPTRAPGATGTPAPRTPPPPQPSVDELPPELEPDGPLPPPTQATPPRPSGGGAGAGLGFGQWDDPATQPALPPAAEQQQPKDDPNRVLAEDWWSHTRPTLELHGYFRTRWEMFHKFHLGRIDAPEDAMFPRPADDHYRDMQGLEHGPTLCTQSEAGTGGNDNPAQANVGCRNNTHAGANMRLRVEPALVISDNLRVRTQIDLLDNLVLGSTPNGYNNVPSAAGYAVAPRDNYEPHSGLAYTQTPPRSGINSLQDSILVKRAWAEYTTPIGQLRFGRMPDHWGLGIYRNAGNDFDGDYQTTVDRIAFFTAVPSLSLHIGGAWDFANELPTSASFSPYGGQPYDLGQQDDVSQYNLIVYRRVDPELERLQLAQGKVVLNGGLYLTYRNQRLAADAAGPCGSPAGGATLDCAPGGASYAYTRRGLNIWTPDLWLELKYRKFHFDMELVTHQGTIQNRSNEPGTSDYQNDNGDDGWKVNQWGLATRMRQKLIEDRLEIGFQFGWASGDSDVEGLVPRGTGAPGLDGVEQLGDRSLQTFRFHPNYRVDLILHRHILNRVQGTYYLRPSARYDFIRRPTGTRLGGLVEAIWTRASQFMQAPGHERDLGIELNGTVYFQSSDGALNDHLQQIGGFYSAVQYGVLFPMSGLAYQSQQTPVTGGGTPELATAQTLRVLLGVIY